MKNVTLPRVIFECCGIKYDTKNANTINFFRAFLHENASLKNEGDFCITVWLNCKNNNCIKARTFFYNKNGKLLNHIDVRGIKYIAHLQNYFKENIVLAIREKRIVEKSNNHLWKYGKSTDGKKQEIYDFNDRRVKDERVYCIHGNKQDK